jgi:hypothetical protein
MSMMMKLLMGLLVLAAAAGGFAASRAMQADATDRAEPAAGKEVMLDWLGAPEDQRMRIRRTDPTFITDLRELRADLSAKRAVFAEVLEDPEHSDEDLRKASEAVIAASADLERRVVDHLIKAREHLTAQQRQRLFSLFAEGIREGRGGWRGGPRDGRGPGFGSGGMGPGGGMGERMGPGRMGEGPGEGMGERERARRGPGPSGR